MPVKLNSSGGGSVTLTTPSTASDFTVTIPAATGTMVTTTSASTVEFAAGSAAAPSITTTGDTNTGIYFPAADTLAFTEGGAEAMRIDSSGNLLVGTTTARAKLTVKSTSDAYTSGGINLERASSTNRWGILPAATNDLYFGYNEVDKGYITNSTGAYTSVSDATLKKDIVDITFGLEAIKGLRPVEYLMVDEAEGQQKHLGFLAQEVQQVLPSSISIMRSGKLGMDKSEIIPVLVKAIQELKADNDAMKERIALLEAK